MSYLKLSLCMLLCVLYCNTTFAQDKNSAKTKDVIVRYVDGEKGISNHLIYFSYYDVGTSSWKTDKKKSDANGYATFKVPLREGGASCSFFYSVEDEKKFNELVSQADNLRLIRIPADTELLELWVNKSGGASNKKGSMQMWSKE